MVFECSAKDFKYNSIKSNYYFSTTSMLIYISISISISISIYIHIYMFVCMFGIYLVVTDSVHLMPNYDVRRTGEVSYWADLLIFMIIDNINCCICPCIANNHYIHLSIYLSIYLPIYLSICNIIDHRSNRPGDQEAGGRLEAQEEVLFQ